MTAEEIKMIVKETVRELKESDLLADKDTFKYAEGAKMLRQYYDDGGNDKEITKALKAIDTDLYVDILPLFYRDGQTMEHLAESMGVDVTTVYRNKRRLVITLYDMVM